MRSTVGATHKRNRVIAAFMTTLDIDGMACGGCEENVTEALEDVSGVESVDADHESGTATVAGHAELAELVRAVEDAGYDADV